MLGIFNNQSDVYFNLAAEEYLLKYKDEDILMLWTSDPCVVVGKHQNTCAEINQQYVFEKEISIARRLTGGGTVYHDRGNLNFTYIVNGKPGKLVDFKRFVSPVVEYLNKLSIQATIGNKNDILINGLKISGNAEHVHKNRVLHHGTLLFSSDLSVLREALNVVPGRYIDKAVQSNRASVVNINKFLSKEITIEKFSSHLFDYLMGRYSNSISYQFNEEELLAIKKLRDEKYKIWNWIFGYSPPFSLIRTMTIDNNDLGFKLYIEKGHISKVETDAPVSLEYYKTFLQNLTGLQFSFPELKKHIENSLFSQNTKIQLTELFF